MDERHSLSREQAAELWQRAAELQEQARTGDQCTPISLHDSDPESVSSDVARLSAVESGIDARFVDSAALQLASEQFLDKRQQSGRLSSALGVYDPTLTERAVVNGTVSQVRSAVAEATESDAFASDPVEIVETGSSVALVYEVGQNLKSMFNEDSFHYQVRSASEIRRYAVLITPRDEQSCEVSMHCTLHRSIRTNAIAMRFIQAFAGAGAGIGGAVLASVLMRSTELAGTGVGSLVAGTAAAAFSITLGALAGKGYRHSYRTSHEKLRGSFRKLLTALRMRVGG
jgi:hypothetical protein